MKRFDNLRHIKHEKLHMGNGKMGLLTDIILE